MAFRSFRLYINEEIDMKSLKYIILLAITLLLSSVCTYAEKTWEDTNIEKMCVAACIILEAGGTQEEEIMAIANVIFNRAKKRGITPYEVVMQPKQFSSIETFRGLHLFQRQIIEKTSVHTKWELAYHLTDLGYKNKLTDLTKGADHFHDTSVNPYWTASMAMTGYSKSFRFYRSQ